MSRKSSRNRNSGHFRKGFDARRRKGFTREEAKRGYARAYEVCLDRGWDASAWLFRTVRSFYRKRKRDMHGDDEEVPAREERR